MHAVRLSPSAGLFAAAGRNRLRDGSRLEPDDDSSISREGQFCEYADPNRRFGRCGGAFGVQRLFGCCRGRGTGGRGQFAVRADAALDQCRRAVCFFPAWPAFVRAAQRPFSRPSAGADLRVYLSDCRRLFGVSGIAVAGMHGDERDLRQCERRQDFVQAGQPGDAAHQRVVFCAFGHAAKSAGVADGGNHRRRLFSGAHRGKIFGFLPRLPHDGRAARGAPLYGPRAYPAGRRQHWACGAFAANFAGGLGYAA